MIIVWIISLLALIVYGAFLYQAWQGYRHSHSVMSQVDVTALSRVSILVPVRNEKNHIKKLLESLLNQSALSCIDEIIILDDHSDDGTWEIIASFSNDLVKYCPLPLAITGKKQALTLGVSMAKNEIILVTDGDGWLPYYWVEKICRTYLNNPDTAMTTGLVMPALHDTILARFQWLDFAATMAITKFGIHHSLFYLANGANMSFRKSVFEKVGGFSGNEHIPSGDDVFLMQKIAIDFQLPVTFIDEKNTVVTTGSISSLPDLWRQRKRWAAKSKVYASWPLLCFQGLVFFISLSLLISGILGWWQGAALGYFALSMLAIKYVLDYIFLKKLAGYFEQDEALWLFPVSFLLYQVYIILMGLHAFFPSKTTWKGRPA